MNFDLQENIFRLLLSLPAFVIAFTIHEFAHAWMAHRCGDDLAKRMGRLTLDPVAHLDPFGSLMFVISSLVGFGIGWAKPVPFDPRNLRNRRRDSMLIAVAGPVSNLLQVPFWMAGLWLFSRYVDSANVAVTQQNIVFYIISMVLIYGILVNIMLAAFNMLPFPPLDGHYILAGFGPPAVEDFFNAVAPYGFMILIALSYLGVLNIFLQPFYGFAMQLIQLASR